MPALGFHLFRDYEEIRELVHAMHCLDMCCKELRKPTQEWFWHAGFLLKPRLGLAAIEIIWNFAIDSRKDPYLCMRAYCERSRQKSLSVLTTLVWEAFPGRTAWVKFLSYVLTSGNYYLGLIISEVKEAGSAAGGRQRNCQICLQGIGLLLKLHPGKWSRTLISKPERATKLSETSPAESPPRHMHKSTR